MRNEGAIAANRTHIERTNSDGERFRRAKGLEIALLLYNSERISFYDENAKLLVIDSRYPRWITHIDHHSYQNRQDILNKFRVRMNSRQSQTLIHTARIFPR